MLRRPRARRCAAPLPVWQHGVAIGFIDLALERAFSIANMRPLSSSNAGRRGARPEEARYSMLERLADYDDALMEQLIGRNRTAARRVFDDLAKELRGGHVVPLLMARPIAVTA